MQIPFLDLKAQYKQIEHEVLPMITEAMANGMFIGGPNVEDFEGNPQQESLLKGSQGIGCGFGRSVIPNSA